MKSPHMIPTKIINQYIEEAYVGISEQGKLAIFCSNVDTVELHYPTNIFGTG